MRIVNVEKRIIAKQCLWGQRYEARDLQCHNGLRPARGEQSLRGLGKRSNDRCVYCGIGSKMQKISTVALTLSAYFVLTTYVAPQGCRCIK